MRGCRVIKFDCDGTGHCIFVFGRKDFGCFASIVHGSGGMEFFVVARFHLE